MSKKIAVSKSERAWLGIMRLNATEKKQEIIKTLKIGRASFNFHWQSKNNLWGRFGGGWNWELGVQFSSWKHVILCLLIFRLTFRFKVIHEEGK